MFSLLGVALVDVNYDLPLENKTPFQHLIISAFNCLGVFFVLFIFIRLIDQEAFIDIGLRLKNRLKDMFWGISLGLFIMGFALLLLLFIDEIKFINFNFELENLIYMFLLFVFVSLSEEFLLRGYVLRNFMYSFNKYIALILSSLIFALMHGANPHIDWISLFDLFLAGILLGLPYIFNKNLWFPIALHFSWNFFQSLFGFNVSGLDTYSLIEFEMLEPNIINGGDFGFEGSILSIIIQIILIIAIFIWYRKKQCPTHATQ
jgi:membrane protease YdiL (CAAX protease family)